MIDAESEKDQELIFFFFFFFSGLMNSIVYGLSYYVPSSQRIVFDIEKGEKTV